LAPGKEGKKIAELFFGLQRVKKKNGSCPSTSSSVTRKVQGTLRPQQVHFEGGGGEKAVSTLRGKKRGKGGKFGRSSIRPHRCNKERGERKKGKEDGCPTIFSEGASIKKWEGRRSIYGAISSMPQPSKERKGGWSSSSSAKRSPLICFGRGGRKRTDVFGRVDVGKGEEKKGPGWRPPSVAEARPREEKRESAT